MNGSQSGSLHSFEKTFPGCLGKMMNLFDLSAGVAGNKRLCDRPHRDGSLLLRSQSDLSRISPRLDDQMEDKMIMSNRKANGTSMKMLIEHELSKENESKHNAPNVVAKLMGLDTLPRTAVSAPNKEDLKGQIRPECRRQENCCFEKEGQKECKDVYEIWKQTPKTKCIDEEKMALVRRKFMEAKRLATDEKLRQSKEFHDAIEVLSSNRELFVKFLQDPNSIFSQNLYDFQSDPPSPETKCINVLRPSNMVDKNFVRFRNIAENNMQKSSEVGQMAFWNKNSGNRVSEHVHPTRIVVLKPNLGKTHDCSVLRASHGSFDEEPEDDEVQKSRVTTREITQRHVNLRSSSVYTNGYNGDESSENEFAPGILSDSEAMSPSPMLSWEGMNKFGSPYSSSFFSRASCSPESSVCREAKKRLSERWAMMATNENSQEQRHLMRSSSTLGEMLALSETKKSIASDHENMNKELDASDSNKCAGDSPKFLVRSKSLPASSIASGACLNVEVSSEIGKTDDLKGLTKAKSMKSSLKGKVSSLFSSRNKKSNKEKHNISPSKAPEPAVDCPERIDEDVYCAKSSGLEACSSATLRGSTDSSLNLTSMQFISSVVFSELGLTFTKPMFLGNLLENQEQPSPISVLEPPFEEDDNGSSYMNSDNKEVLLSIKSNLIDKSPPIESIARKLTWDSSCSSPYSFKPSSICEGTEEEQQMWRVLVHQILSAAGLEGKLRRDSIFPQWHSLEYPLDPSLGEKYANLHDKEPRHEAKRRQLRSSRKLVFDCVNAALVDAAIFGSETSESLSLEDSIWSRIKEWLSEARCISDDDRDSDSFVVEKVVKKEVGKQWVEGLRVESDNLSKEIERKLLEALVEEAATDLIGIIR